MNNGVHVGNRVGNDDVFTDQERLAGEISNPDEERPVGVEIRDAVSGQEEGVRADGVASADANEATGFRTAQDRTLGVRRYPSLLCRPDRS